MHACMYLVHLGPQLSLISSGFRDMGTQELQLLRALPPSSEIVSCSWFWQFGTQLVLFVDCEPVLNLDQDIIVCIGTKTPRISTRQSKQ